MSALKSHKDLQAWQLAVSLAQQVYAATKRFPKDDRYGLTMQIRRSAVSIASNIAEGAARHGTKEFVQFLYIASRSASELDTQLEIAKGRITGSLEEIAVLQQQGTCVDDVTGADPISKDLNTIAITADWRHGPQSRVTNHESHDSHRLGHIELPRLSAQCRWRRCRQTRRAAGHPQR